MSSAIIQRDLLRRHHVVVADDVVDLHAVDPISKAARVAATKHR
jgi:hypothetical protein